MSRKDLLTSGWKSVSLVDVHSSVSFTLWLCGCNLKCPFCHNWRLAEGDAELCRWINVDEVVEALTSSIGLIDYIHVTGGEPLIQWRGLIKLFEKVRELSSVKTSLNTNLTLAKPLKKLLEKNLVDHIATDLKIPHQELYGLPKQASNRLWSLFLENVKTISEYNVSLELRVPVSRLLSPELLEDAVLLMEKYLRRVNDLTIIIQPLLGRPVTNPRNVEWCTKYCNVQREFLESLAEVFKNHGFTRIAVAER
ncbi:MAG: anaerobic ribonucleoside-triphosphate reductase activating protein [Thermosphaera sp.]